jgi:hypothetical protein
LKDLQQGSFKDLLGFAEARSATRIYAWIDFISPKQDGSRYA